MLQQRGGVRAGVHACVDGASFISMVHAVAGASVALSEGCVEQELPTVYSCRSGFDVTADARIFCWVSNTVLQTKQHATRQGLGRCALARATAASATAATPSRRDPWYHHQRRHEPRGTRGERSARGSMAARQDLSRWVRRRTRGDAGECPPPFMGNDRQNCVW